MTTTDFPEPAPFLQRLIAPRWDNWRGGLFVFLVGMAIAIPLLPPKYSFWIVGGARGAVRCDGDRQCMGPLHRGLAGGACARAAVSDERLPPPVVIRAVVLQLSFQSRACADLGRPRKLRQCPQRPRNLGPPAQHHHPRHHDRHGADDRRLPARAPVLEAISAAALPADPRSDADDAVFRRGRAPSSATITIRPSGSCRRPCVCSLASRSS